MIQVGLIEQELKTASGKELSFFIKKYQDDDRLGVQKLVQRANRQIDAYEKECLRTKQLWKYEEEYAQTCLTMEECERERRNEVSREEALNIERTSLQQKKERLDSSDISRLMEQKLEAEQKLVKAERDFEEKKKSLAEKEEKEIQLHYSLKEQRGKLEQQGEEIAGKLDDMEAGLQFLTFDEHVFMADELKSGLSSPYSFHSLREQMGTIRRDIDLGTELLDKRQRITEKQEDILVQLEKLRQEQQSCVLLKRDQEEQSRQVKSEWEEEAEEEEY